LRHPTGHKDIIGDIPKHFLPLELPEHSKWAKSSEGFDEDVPQSHGQRFAVDK